MKLIIIGNGFDCSFGLPTTVNTFKEIIEKYDYEDLYTSSGVYWNEYEESLANLDLDEMSERFVEGPDYASEREGDRDGVIWQVEENMSEMMSIKEKALIEMVENANELLMNYNEELIFVDSSLILSFNYTSTVEELFSFENIIDIYHLHGYLVNNEELIFGYSDMEKKVLSNLSWYDVITGNYIIDKSRNEYIQEAQEHGGYDGTDYYIQQQYELFFNFYEQNKKCLKVRQLIDFLCPYVSEIDEVVVLGHSLAIVDAPYFEIIEDIVKPLRWSVSQFNNNPNNQSVENYTFKNKINFFNNIENYFKKIN